MRSVMNIRLFPNGVIKCGIWIAKQSMADKSIGKTWQEIFFHGPEAMNE
jgi:hypothetical protein